MNIDVDDGAFLAGFHDALKDFTREVEDDQHDRAKRILAAARHYVHRASGETLNSLGVTEGHDEHGRFWEVGSSLEKAFYENFGTVHAAGSHFMTIALAKET